MSSRGWRHNPLPSVDMGHVPGSSLRELEIAICLALAFPRIVSMESFCLQSVNLFDEGKAPQTIALPVCSAHRDRARLCSLWGTLRLPFWWMMSFLQPSCSQQRQHPRVSFLCGLLGEGKYVSRYWFVLPCEFLLGFIALGFTEYFFSFGTCPSLMFNNSTVWR